MSDQFFKNRTVLVTGAGGSIGTYLCRTIASQEARELRLLSISESALYNVERTLRREYEKYRDTKLVPILGSACNDQLLNDVLADVDVIIHAAAHKHVPLCECNPFEAITNNVGSAWALMWAAFRARVPQLCIVSTDKAVNAKSIMGATKRLAEIILQDIPLPDVFTDCFAVRFGNVLDSAGSVLPLWREQIAAGEPITLTDERCERYFMSIPQAAALVCDVVSMRPREGTYVLEMGAPVSLKSLAEKMLAAGSKIPIKIVGLRPGEKLTEELHFGGSLSPTKVEKVFRVHEDNHRPRVHADDVDTLLRLAEERRKEALPLLWKLIGGAT
jgi:FlaA1/EpsC-like NDP-sugar epimerase